MNACARVGIVWPTLRVPGIRRSGTTPRSRKSVVVVAKEPTPSVSKKSVTRPMNISYAEGMRPRNGAFGAERGDPAVDERRAEACKKEKDGAAGHADDGT